MNTEDWVGQWRVTAITLKGKTISLKRGDSIRAHLKEINEQINMETDTSTQLKSGFVRRIAAGMIRSAYKKTTLTLRADETYQLYLSEVSANQSEKGYWRYNAQQQTIELYQQSPAADRQSTDKRTILIEGDRLVLENKVESLLEALVFTRKR